MVLLETGRLRLRQFTAADVDRLVELDSDAEVMRYITYGVPTPREVYLEEILPRWLRIYRETPLLGYWAAEDRGSGGFHGWFHLRPDRIDAGEQELGFRLRRASWGQGLATEGASALVDHGLVRVGTETISARTLAANRASRAVMEKCGLRYERDFTFPRTCSRAAAPRSARP